MKQEQLVQSIAISKNRGSHEEVIKAVALASVAAWLNSPELPEWETWLAERFTKSVRRGSLSQIATVGPLSQSSVMVGGVEALGFAPMTYDDFPPALSKMQVAKTERPTSDSWPVDPLGGPILWLDEKNQMTTGKTAAQVAHGLFAWLLKLGEDERYAWRDDGMPISIVLTNRFEAQLADAVVVIEDAGFTEVEPNTVTIIVTMP